MIVVESLPSSRNKFYTSSFWISTRPSSTTSQLICIYCFSYCDVWVSSHSDAVVVDVVGGGCAAVDAATMSWSWPLRRR